VPVFFYAGYDSITDVDQEPGCLNVNADGSVVIAHGLEKEIA
jgi:hypothetical protein